MDSKIKIGLAAIIGLGVGILIGRKRNSEPTSGFIGRAASSRKEEIGEIFAWAESKLNSLYFKKGLSRDNIQSFSGQINAIIDETNKKLKKNGYDVTVSVSSVGTSEKQACDSMSGKVCLRKSILFGLVSLCVCIGKAEYGGGSERGSNDSILQSLDNKLKYQVISRGITSSNVRMHADFIQKLVNEANSQYRSEGKNIYITFNPSNPSEIGNCSSEQSSGDVCAMVSLAWGLIQFCRCFGRHKPSGL